MAYRGFSGMGSSGSGSSNNENIGRDKTPERRNPVKVIIIDGDNKKEILLNKFPEMTSIGSVLARQGILRQDPIGKDRLFGKRNNFDDYYTTITIDGKVIHIDYYTTAIIDGKVVHIDRYDIGMSGLGGVRFYDFSKKSILNAEEGERKFKKFIEERRMRISEEQRMKENEVVRQSKESQQKYEESEEKRNRILKYDKIKQNLLLQGINLNKEKEEGKLGYYDEFGNLDITITLTKKQKKKRGFFGLWGGGANGGGANRKGRTRRMKRNRRRKARKTSKRR